jgi:hypothetical protein
VHDRDRICQSAPQHRYQLCAPARASVDKNEIRRWTASYDPSDVTG